MVSKLNKLETRRFDDWWRNNLYLQQFNKLLLKEFYKNQISELSVQEKIAVTKYYRETQNNLLDFNKEKLGEIKKYYLESKRIAAQEGYLSFKRKVGEEEREFIKLRRVEKIKTKRISKLKLENPELSEKELLNLSYLKGILRKGRNNAKALGIELSNLSEKEIMELSGLQKKINFSQLTKEQKVEARIKWKKTNLKNLKVKDLLKRFYPKFLELNLDLLTEEDIEKWYSQYISLRTVLNSKERLIGRPKFKSGWFWSEKLNKKIYYRSSYEEKVCEFLELNEKVIAFETEPFHIKYKRDGEDSFRNYVPDFLVEYKNKRILLEVKPEVFVNEFNFLKGNYVKKEIGANFIFVIITEKQLNENEFYKHIEKHF